jgi:hypothetical protein
MDSLNSDLYLRMTLLSFSFEAHRSKGKEYHFFQALKGFESSEKEVPKGACYLGRQVALSLNLARGPEN